MIMIIEIKNLKQKDCNNNTKYSLIKKKYDVDDELKRKFNFLFIFYF